MASASPSSPHTSMHKAPSPPTTSSLLTAACSKIAINASSSSAEICRNSAQHIEVRSSSRQPLLSNFQNACTKTTSASLRKHFEATSLQGQDQRRGFRCSVALFSYSTQDCDPSKQPASSSLHCFNSSSNARASGSPRCANDGATFPYSRGTSPANCWRIPM